MDRSGSESPLPQRSIQFYSTVFLLIALFIFVIAITFSFQAVQKVDQHLNELTDANAHQEISHLIQQYEEELRERMRLLTDWDETRQQIDRVAYYTYWKQHRLLENQDLPQGLVDIHLYRSDGSILVRTEPELLPNQMQALPASEPEKIMVDADGEILVFFPVSYSGQQGSRIKGYLGARIDFFRLLADRQINFIVPGSLQLNPLSAPVALDELVDHVTYEIPENRDVELLVDVIRQTLVIIMLGALILSLMFYSGAIRLVERPLTLLLNHIRSLQSNPDGDRVMNEQLVLRELDQIRVALNDYQYQLINVHENLDAKNQELTELAYHDALTGCYNRRAFDNHWNNWIDDFAGTRLNISMVLFDCNHFKAINDTYGHEAGDIVLREISNTIQETLRAGDRLYRIGGDEFVLILLDSDQVSAQKLAKRCLEGISKHDFFKLGIKEDVRVSIGIASAVSTDREALRQLHWQADLAMYQAKRPSNQAVVCFTKEMGDKDSSVLSNAVTTAVHNAIAGSDNMIMYYQPIQNLETGQVEYYEALVRIKEQGKVIAPLEILQVVEDRRLEPEFDHAVIATVLKDLKSGQLPQGTGVSINLSGPSVVDERVIQWLKPFEPFVGRYKLQLEVTETTLIRHLHVAERIVHRLRKMGFLIALDDFGSGYSALGYLAKMPVDLVKFDITLVRGLEEVSKQRYVVEGLAGVIMKAGFPLVAEGIETQEMLDRVRTLGFDYVQGYFIGRPAPLQSDTIHSPLQSDIIH
jgi:diguanylate cyclase (GGDEF)-like protein